jgi:hypothetical protein
LTTAGSVALTRLPPLVIVPGLAGARPPAEPCRPAAVTCRLLGRHLTRGGPR